MRWGGWLCLGIYLIVNGCRGGYPPAKINELEKKIKSSSESEISALRQERDELNRLLEDTSWEIALLKSELEKNRQELKKSGEEISRLKEVLSKLEEELKKTSQVKIPPPPPPPIIKQAKIIRGKVRSIITENNILIISIGKNDSLEPGMELEVRRAEKVLGKIKLETVESNWSTALAIIPAEIKLFEARDDVCGILID